MYLRITVDGTAKDLSTKRLWSPKRWNSAIGRANGNKEEDRTLNAYLDSLHHKVLQAKKQLID
uniref:Arm DNA-binding domain-containing protein n=1 Tax=Algoriphagus locisalis TaxID=305507 RepID=UPI001FCE0D37|nr:Arm DNA-binding domain-containing protein [Algoriphagus locisalis]